MENLSETDPAHATPPKRRSFFGKFMRGQGSDTSSTQTPTENDRVSENSSENSLPPLSELNLHGYSKCSHHKLIDQLLAADIRGLLPPRLQLYDDWELIYSLEQDGISLNTLYRHSSPEWQQEQLRKKEGKKSGLGYAENVVRTMVLFGLERPTSARAHGYILVIQDEKKNRFGCFINEPLRPNDHRRYYGNGECFLWKTEWFGDKLEKTHGNDPRRQQRFKAFPYTGVNDNIIYSNHNFIAIGSSLGNNGLWIDKLLYLGVSYPCETFGNEILNEHGHTGHKYGKFKIISLELWRVGNLA